MFKEDSCPVLRSFRQNDIEYGVHKSPTKVEGKDRVPQQSVGFKRTTEKPVQPRLYLYLSKVKQWR